MRIITHNTVLFEVYYDMTTLSIISNNSSQDTCTNEDAKSTPCFKSKIKEKATYYLERTRRRLSSDQSLIQNRCRHRHSLSFLLKNIQSTNRSKSNKNLSDNLKIPNLSSDNDFSRFSCKSSCNSNPSTPLLYSSYFGATKTDSMMPLPLTGFFFSQVEGYWLDATSITKSFVKLPNTTFGELCPKELETLARMAIERLKKHKEIPTKDLIKYQFTTSTKKGYKTLISSGKQLSGKKLTSNHNLLDKDPDSHEFNGTILFGDKLSDVVERDTLQRFQKLTELKSLEAKAEVEQSNPQSHPLKNVVKTRKCHSESDRSVEDDGVDSNSFEGQGIQLNSIKDEHENESSLEPSPPKSKSIENTFNRRRKGIRTPSLGPHETQLLEAIAHPSTQDEEKQSNNKPNIEYYSLKNSLTGNNSQKSNFSESQSNSVGNSSDGLLKISRKKKPSKSFAEDLLVSNVPMVPLIVLKCCEYITEHGLGVVGIFRKSAAASKVKELRVYFEEHHVSGKYRGGLLN